MRTRTPGQGLDVSTVGLGCMGMSQRYSPNPGDRDNMITVLREPSTRWPISTAWPRRSGFRGTATILSTWPSSTADPRPSLPGARREPETA